MTTTSAPARHLDSLYQRAAFIVRRDERATYPAIAERFRFRNAAAAQHAVYYGAQAAGEQVPTTRRATRRAADANPTAGARRFGCEIELVRLSVREAHEALRAAGISSYVQSYNADAHAVPPAGSWKVIHDGSVSGGAEVVSPILSGEAGFAALTEVMAALRAAGGRVDRQCGLHVHHEVIDMTGEEIARIVEFYAARQAAVNTLLAPSRRTAYYTRPMEAYEVADFAERLRRVTATTADAKRAEARRNGIGGRPGTRYRMLNVHSFGNYGTIEFRQHQGTLNAAKAIAWIKFGQAIIDAARYEDRIASDRMLADLVAAGRLDSDTAAYLTDRQADLASA